MGCSRTDGAPLPPSSTLSLSLEVPLCYPVLLTCATFDDVSHVNHCQRCLANQSLLMMSHTSIKGTVIVFDELLNYNGFERHEMRALFEMMEKEGGVGSRLKLEWIGSKHEGCMSVAVKMVGK